MTTELLYLTDFSREIEKRINVEVAAARPIQVRILPREEAFEIPDLIGTKIYKRLRIRPDPV